MRFDGFKGTWVGFKAGHCLVSFGSVWSSVLWYDILVLYQKLTILHDSSNKTQRYSSKNTIVLCTTFHTGLKLLAVHCTCCTCCDPGCQGAVWGRAGERSLCRVGGEAWRRQNRGWRHHHCHCQHNKQQVDTRLNIEQGFENPPATTTVRWRGGGQ